MIDDVAIAILEGGFEGKPGSPLVLTTDKYNNDNTILHTWINGEPTPIPIVSEAILLGESMNNQGSIHLWNVEFHEQWGSYGPRLEATFAPCPGNRPPRPGPSQNVGK